MSVLRRERVEPRCLSSVSETLVHSQLNLVHASVLQRQLSLVSSRKCFCIIAIDVFRKHKNRPIVPSRNPKVLQQYKNAMSIYKAVISMATAKTHTQAVCIGLQCIYIPCMSGAPTADTPWIPTEGHASWGKCMHWHSRLGYRIALETWPLHDHGLSRVCNTLEHARQKLSGSLHHQDMWSTAMTLLLLFQELQCPSLVCSAEIWI